MKKAYAEIRWNTPAEGGRTVPLQSGSIYYPLIAINSEIDPDPWSVCFVVPPTGDDGTSKICFSMLVDNNGTSTFFNKLCIGMQFKLLEGHRVVATGIITAFG